MTCLEKRKKISRSRQRFVRLFLQFIGGFFSIVAFLLNLFNSFFEHLCTRWTFNIFAFSCTFICPMTFFQTFLTLSIGFVFLMSEMVKWNLIDVQQIQFELTVHALMHVVFEAVRCTCRRKFDFNLKLQNNVYLDAHSDIENNSIGLFFSPKERENELTDLLLLLRILLRLRTK